MKDEKLVAESIEQAMQRILARMPPEQRLAGLAPEQRVAGLAPEQVLRAYAPEQVLRALSEDYLATLPPETRAAIQKRLGAVEASPRKPARRRRSA